MTHQTAALAALVQRLAADPNPRARFTVFADAIITEGGTLILPEPGNNWSGMNCVLSLHGVFAANDDCDAALAEWLQCARRVIAADADSVGHAA